MILILTILLLVLAVAVFRPTLLLPLSWVVVMCYPQGFLYGKLPLNIGLDDLFLILASVITIFRLNRRAPISHSKNLLFIIIGLFLMQTLAEISGSLQYTYLSLSTIRNALKGLVVLAYVVALIMDIRGEKDVRRHVFWMTAALTVAFAIVIVCYYVPGFAELWEVRDPETSYMMAMTSNRSFGAFNGPAEVGGVACLTVPLMIGILLNCWHDRRVRNLTFVGLLVVLGGTALISKSRSAIVAIGLMLALALILSHKRLYIMAVGVVLVAVLGYIVYWNVVSISPISDRFVGGVLSEDFSSRLDIWRSVVANPPRNILFGSGSDALFENLGATPHNGYLDIFYCWGLFGLFMFTWLVYTAVKWSRWVLKHDTFPLGLGVAWGLLWGLVTLGFASMATDPWYMMLLRLLLFGMLIIVHRRFYLTHYAKRRDTLRSRV